mmetsp:Transcript_38568/g.81978  ORF Transcript_38568/g.81978 Transcript_38568/m.81978 type:complete len:535 (+) Transcript_38568:156-1760(+)|eukprot:CAMPEP_0180421328 /NCGR_PEP_ID=MMETSP1036_2-20121128/3094_1 /TAXON_ID=632150 /ORGANISM="Azadinium spinosum, Strain 3D9" /LENGTH=534 /DNA_ID=CAMNT_0022426589 /DNA_START=130 /DNA_END=1734 /DNA_ORIENTATION=-
MGRKTAKNISYGRIVWLALGMVIGLGIAFSVCASSSGAAIATNVASFERSADASSSAILAGAQPQSVADVQRVTVGKAVTDDSLTSSTAMPKFTAGANLVERNIATTSVDSILGREVEGILKTSRTQIEGGVGCYAIKSRVDCCHHIDGRHNEFKGLNCTPAPFHAVFPSGNLCEPSCYTSRKCGDAQLEKDDIVSCEQIMLKVRTFTPLQLMMLEDPSGPEGVFQDWVVTGARRPDAVVGMVLLRHRDVVAFDFDMKRAPPWAKMIFAVNRDFCRRHGYKLVLRDGGHALPTPWQSQQCGKRHHTSKDIYECQRKYDGENNSWEKCAMMVHYLERSGARHVLLLDADAAFVHKEQDTVGNLIRELEVAGKDMLLANIDYEKGNGPNRLSCSMMFAKSTDFTRTLFNNLVQAHKQGQQYKGPGGPCNGDCHCFESWVQTYPQLKEHLLVVSGLRYNRQECTFRCCTSCPTNTALPGLDKRSWNDPELEVLHFASGNSRGAAVKILKGRRPQQDDVKQFLLERVPDTLPSLPFVE